MNRKPQSKLPDAAVPPVADPPSIPPHELTEPPAEPRRFTVPEFISITSTASGRLLAVDRLGMLWDGYIDRQARFDNAGHTRC